MADAIQLEASTDRILLEDGTGVVLLEVDTAVVLPPGPLVVNFAVPRSFTY